MIEYLATHGRQAIVNGYRIVPIRPRLNGESEKSGKAPGLLVPQKLLSGWQQLNWTTDDVDVSVANGNGGCGIGVLTKDTPAVDIDCTDEAMVDKIRAYVEKTLGATIERVGNAPKTLLLFRTDEPFPKITSKGYAEGKVEILGQGQQFVALAQHPVTGAPYVWLDGNSIANVETWELPTLNREQGLAICAKFDEMAAEAGWAVMSAASRGNFRQDSPFVSDKPKVTDLSMAEIHEIVARLPNEDDYDVWLQVGMALFHQFEGSDEGFDLWNEWSEKSSKHVYDFGRTKWESGTFEVEGKGVEPTSFRYIIKKADEAVAVETRTKFDEAMAAIVRAGVEKDKEGLSKATRLARVIDISEFDRMDLAKQTQIAFKEATGGSLLRAEALRMVRYSPTALPHTPEWLEGFVYVEEDKGFYNTRTGRMLSVEVFDAVHSRLLLSKEDRLAGKAKPDKKPSDVALNVFTIQHVSDRRYAPDEPLLFTLNGVPYVNSYAERGLPVVPAITSASGEAAVERIKGHIRHLIDNERDAEIFTSFLAYIVQTRKRVNWGIFLQGAQGDGKTFFTELMGAVLAADNVNVITGSSLEEKYTGWAERSLLVFVEEVRLGGENRYKVIDRVKPLITNSTISIRRMHRNEYLVPNKASYFLISNFRDALPVGDEDNRYFPVFSRWQSQEKLVEFKRANPLYYRQLYATLTESGAIRKWLLSYELSPHFNAEDRAPVSSSKAEMTEASADPLTEAVKQVIDDSLDLSAMLFDSSKVAQAVYDFDPSLPPLNGKRLQLQLQKAGFTSLGLIKVNGEARRFWSAEPERFRRLDDQGVSVIDTEAVRAFFR